MRPGYYRYDELPEFWQRVVNDRSEGVYHRWLEDCPAPDELDPDAKNWIYLVYTYNHTHEIRMNPTYKGITA